MSKKVKHPKLDPHVVSLKQKYEIDYIVSRFKKLGKVVTKDLIKAAVKAVGRGRKNVYLYLNIFGEKCIDYKPKKR